MVKVLLLKELKESAWIWLIAAGVYVVFALDTMNVRLLPDMIRSFFRTDGYGVEIPFVNSQIAQIFDRVTSVFAVAMGIWQSIADSRHGTYPVLLHLPMSRRSLIGVKVVIGLALILALSGIALLSICLWAATPGTHASPFEWEMTWPAWQIWFAAPLLYFGAFVTGLYPARWFGTRLFPLLTVFCAVGTFSTLGRGGIVSHATIALIVLATYGLYIAALDYLIRTRDFS